MLEQPAAPYAENWVAPVPAHRIVALAGRPDAIQVDHQ